MENLKDFLEAQVDEAEEYYYSCIEGEEENELLIDNAWNELYRTFEAIGGAAWLRGATEAQITQAVDELYGAYKVQAAGILSGWNEAEYGY